MKGAEQHFSVDRLENTDGGIVVIVVGNSGKSSRIPAAALGIDLKEGDIIRVPHQRSRLIWTQATIDKAETNRRKKEGAEILSRLSRGDTGGDIKL